MHPTLIRQIRQRGKFLGYVEAQDQETAIKEAIKHFEVKDPQQKKRLGCAMCRAAAGKSTARDHPKKRTQWFHFPRPLSGQQQTPDDGGSVANDPKATCTSVPVRCCIRALFSLRAVLSVFRALCLGLW
jgi:hypothetical protein